MEKSPLLEQSMQFSIEVVRLCDGIQRRSVLTNQLLRAATSVGANIREGKYGSSRADFVAKYQIALKECYESEYWLELLQRTDIITINDCDACMKLCAALRRMLSSAIISAKNKMV